MKIYLTIEPEADENFEVYETTLEGGLTYVKEQLDNHLYSFEKTLPDKTYQL